MEPNLINDFLQAIANGVVATVGNQGAGLIPVGLQIMTILTSIAIMMLGFSLAAGGFMAHRIVNFLIITAATKAAIANFATVVLALPGLARGITGEIIPGYNGPTTLFASAIEVANRLGHASVSFSFTSVSDALASIGALLGSGFIIPAIFIGMISAGVGAVVMEICLLIGAMVGPLLLPFLAFNLTAPIGMAFLTFMVYAVLEVVMMGALSHFMAAAITSVIMVPGRGDEITNTDVFVLLGIGAIMTAASATVFYMGARMVGAGFGTISSSLTSTATNAVGSLAQSGSGGGRTAGAPAWAGSGGGGGGPSGGPGWAGSGEGWAGSSTAGGGKVTMSGAAVGRGSPFARATP